MAFSSPGSCLCEKLEEFHMTGFQLDLGRGLGGQRLVIVSLPPLTASRSSDSSSRTFAFIMIDLQTVYMEANSSRPKIPIVSAKSASLRHLAPLVFVGDYQ